MAGNREKAVRIISSYYRRIAEANEMFSRYKEGWMTDRGMIYIIYGPPNDVSRNLDEEVWTYEKTVNMNKIKFTFMSVRNLFTDQHYELERNDELRQTWFRAIDLWRKGILAN